MNFFQKLISMILSIFAMLGFWGSETKPEIKEGEFDFILTYELDGDIGTIEGTYVCKFEKVEYYLDGISRQWTGYIKGHEESTSYVLKTSDEGVIKVDLDICADFFMSDPNYQNMKSSDDPKPEPFVYITADDLHYDNYEGDDVRIISFEYDAPIENIYK